MSIEEIRKDINSLNNQIMSLGNERASYQNMNNQINQIIVELSTSYNYIEDAQEQLLENYDSETSKEKLGELREQAKEINELIRILRDEILVESNRRINSINAQIQERQNTLSRKNRELQEERNKE